MNSSFFSCIADICGLELACLCHYKYSVFGGRVAVVEGHNGISSYDCCKVTFKLKGGCISILGNSLKIKTLDKHFAVVVGIVQSVEVTK